ncbi:MAG: helicase, partial [Candidatus Dormibacteraeota bacterium]|nr:helicase [Candidatus Dormibacteraeota bacterium]
VEEQDELATDGATGVEEGPAEVSTPQAPTLFPSSFGLSFCVDSAIAALEITATWGHYTRTESAVLTTAKTGVPLRVWQRQPRGGTQTVPLAEAMGPFAPDPEQPDVLVRGRARCRDGAWIVTLFLVNGQEEPKQNRDSAWIFQPELRVRAPGGAAVFQRRVPLGLPAAGPDSVAALEAASLAMIYRRQVEFAVGHGVSVHATMAPTDSTCAVELATRVAPTYEVPQTQAPTPAEIPGLHAAMFDMRTLAETAPEDLAATLTPLATAYEQWIAAQATRLAQPAGDLAAYRQPAEAALAGCRAALARIREGIALLATDPQAAAAFRFLNQAMWQQRVHTLLAAAQRRGEPADHGTIDTPANRSWRPFQIAFILLNLPGITHLQHPDRAAGSQATADLLWFPTGGGKTEAYLGLTAYTLAIRRLQGPIAGRSGEAGVAVLMRYTLRLLTLQQFQRAAALICACEMIRRETLAAGDPRWGRIPFRLGLWVGMRTTPNTTEASHEAITQDRGMYTPGQTRSGSPAQLTHCPWCGTPIDPGKHIVADVKGARRTFLYCGDPLGTCPFTAKKAPHEGLPLVVVDDETYRLLPALVIATVDKFAQMPWNGAVQMLFGQVDKYCPRHGFRSPTISDADSHQAEGLLPAVRSVPHAALRPPDLIIQDELHLISGPLGTLVGLYESAVDRLASWDVDGRRVRPKVIASTATIRRAADQVHALFLRKVAIFPPQGLDADDNFFARQRPPDLTAPGRRYLGICANGKRLKAALIRVYVA